MRLGVESALTRPVPHPTIDTSGELSAVSLCGRTRWALAYEGANRLRYSVSKIRTVRRGIPACLAVVLVASCGVSQQQEVELGANTAAQVSAELPLIRDASVVGYINTLGNQLAAATDTRNLSWQFTVVDSKEVNAFAVLAAGCTSTAGSSSGRPT